MSALTVSYILSSTASFFSKKQIEAPRLEAELLLAEALGLDRLRLYMEYDRPLTQSEIGNFKKLISKRLSGVPLAYILGRKSFLKWDFIVTPDVLIPRPETELLVEKTVETVTSMDERDQAGNLIAENCEAKSSGIKTLLELGTGSGAVAVSLLHYLPNITVDAVDLSFAAVKIAAENAAALGVKDRITFYTGDLYNALPENNTHRYYGIVSNPPYIPTDVIPTLSNEVRAEPPLALDGGKTGLEILKRIFERAKEFLTAGGFLALEHGAGQLPQVEELARAGGFSEIVSYKDYSGFDRVVICK